MPIQALTVREMLYDDKGELVRETPQRRRRGANIETPVSASNEPPPGHTRKETEGVFVVRDNRGVFTPVKVGIAGEQYFEVLSGLKAGDQVITGPFASVRELADGGEVKLQQNARDNRNRQTDHEMNQILDSIVHRAAGHLGQQAALVHDGARQHRGGHLHRHGGDRSSRA